MMFSQDYHDCIYRCFSYKGIFSIYFIWKSCYWKCISARGNRYNIVICIVFNRFSKWDSSMISHVVVSTKLFWSHLTFRTWKHFLLLINHDLIHCPSAYQINWKQYLEDSCNADAIIKRFQFVFAFPKSTWQVMNITAHWIATLQ